VTVRTIFYIGIEAHNLLRSEVGCSHEGELVGGRFQRKITEEGLAEAIGVCGSAREFGPDAIAQFVQGKHDVGGGAADGGVEDVC
jgi:hypothetical protein